MRLRIRKGRLGAMTTIEFLVVIVCFLIAAALLWLLASAGRGLQKICARAIRQVDIAFRVWEGGDVNQFPMTVSASNGGAMEPIEPGNLAAYFQTSNGLRTPKIFICPADRRRIFATNWNERKGSHVSYILSTDASNDSETGMENLVMDGKPVMSGLLKLSSNASVYWPRTTRHRSRGNIGFADGSVGQENSPNSLRRAFQRTGLVTNRIVIP